MLSLDKIALPGLKKIAKELKIKGFSTMKKTELHFAIYSAVEEDEARLAVAEEMAEELATETPEKTSKNPSLGITELTFNGKTQSIAAWADEVGLARPALYDRINRHGWSVEEALTIPKGGRRKKPEVEGQVSMDEVDDEE